MRGRKIQYVPSNAAKKTDTAPIFGWCAGSHRPRKPAQSGYTDARGNRYCKPCYREKFPRLYAQKIQRRKEACGFCGKDRELSQGFCKPCIAARACDTCGEVNTVRSAMLCTNCGTQRQALGAVGARLALWCLICTSADDRESGHCRKCHEFLHQATE